MYPCILIAASQREPMEIKNAAEMPRRFHGLKAIRIVSALSPSFWLSRLSNATYDA